MQTGELNSSTFFIDELHLTYLAIGLIMTVGCDKSCSSFSSSCEFADVSFDTLFFSQQDQEISRCQQRARYKHINITPILPTLLSRFFCIFR